MNDKENTLSYFDRMLSNLHDLPDVIRCKATTLRVIPPFGMGSQVYVVQTYRQKEVGDLVFIENVSDNQTYRIVLPPAVSHTIARQRDQLTGKSRSRAAKRVAEDRKERGLKPGFMRKASKVVLMMFVLSSTVLLGGCEKLARRLYGVNDPVYVDIPKTTVLERTLPAEGTITFEPDNINGTPSVVNAYVKNCGQFVACPGAWYQIDVKYDFDVSVSTEYVVVDLLSQSAHVYNQPAFPNRTITVESVPPGGSSRGRPAQ